MDDNTKQNLNEQLVEMVRTTMEGMNLELRSVVNDSMSIMGNKSLEVV